MQHTLYFIKELPKSLLLLLRARGDIKRCTRRPSHIDEFGPYKLDIREYTQIWSKVV